MANNLLTVTLSSEEVIQLKEAVSEDEVLLSDINSFETDSRGRLILELELETAEILREYLTRQLAKVGFDKAYAPTKKGVILETMIDKFYTARP